MSGFILEKKDSSSGSHSTSKYYIKCDDYVSERLRIVEMLKGQRTSENQVLLAYIESHLEKVNKVIKMSRENGTIRTEYEISKRLHEAGCPGFIQFICIFECYDTNNPNKICQGLPESNNKKEVIVMNYFPEGSIKNHKWSAKNFNTLKCIIMQVIVSAVVAYNTIGFIHNDFHLDNIMVKRTSRTEILYNINGETITIPTNNYTCVIMDFEGCLFTNDKKNTRMFWSSIQNVIHRLTIELKNQKGDRIELTNCDTILQMVIENKKINAVHTNALLFLDLINTSDIITTPLITNMVYDPNKF